MHKNRETKEQSSKSEINFNKETSLTLLSRLKVKLADTWEKGIRSNAATAPASLFFITASDAEDGGIVTKLEVFLDIIPLPTKTGASKGPWQLNTAVTDPANCTNDKL